jgi:hypothetical protein
MESHWPQEYARFDKINFQWRGKGNIYVCSRHR